MAALEGLGVQDRHPGELDQPGDCRRDGAENAPDARHAGRVEDTAEIEQQEFLGPVGTLDGDDVVVEGIDVDRGVERGAEGTQTERDGEDG